jgi:hypothetical protein
MLTVRPELPAALVMEIVMLNCQAAALTLGKLRKKWCLEIDFMRFD